MSEVNRVGEGMRRNLARLASGAVFSQALLLASTPLLTRLYDPDAFGMMAVFSAAYALSIPITTLKYDAAIILPKSAQSAISITAMVVFIASTFALLAGGILWVGTQLAMPHAQDLHLWLPLALWLGAMYTLTQQWSARHGNYSTYARSQIIGAILNVGTSLAFGIWGGGRPEYLIMGFVSGMAGSLAYMCWSRRDSLSLIFGQSLGGVFKRLKVYRQFPGLVLPTTFLIIIGQSSIPLVLTAFYAMDQVGQFAVANRLLLVPAGMIGGAIIEAFRSEFVRRQRNRQEVLTMFKNTLRSLSFIALPLFVVLAIIAPALFSLVFGAGYEESGYVARAVALGVAAQFIGNPFANVFVALRRTALGFRVQIGTTVIPLLLLCVAAAAGFSLTAALTLYAVVSALSIGMMLLIAYKLCVMSDTENKARVRSD